MPCRLCCGNGIYLGVQVDVVALDGADFACHRVIELVEFLAQSQDTLVQKLDQVCSRLLRRLLRFIQDICLILLAVRDDQPLALAVGAVQ